MKKKIFKLLTGMLLSCALAGSTVAVQAEEAGTDTVKSYLTGEDVSVGIGHRRPIAVMLGNDTNGAPQSGTENAGVIYEAPVEGSITRLMAIIEDYDNIPRIGSVRSCRDYFLFYANEYDAIFSLWTGCICTSVSGPAPDRQSERTYTWKCLLSQHRPCSTAQCLH